MQEEDSRRVIDTEEVKRKAEAIQGKSRSHREGVGAVVMSQHCSGSNLRSKCPGKDTLTH